MSNARREINERIGALADIFRKNLKDADRERKQQAERVYARKVYARIAGFFGLDPSGIRANLYKEGDYQGCIREAYAGTDIEGISVEAQTISYGDFFKKGRFQSTGIFGAFRDLFARGIFPVSVVFRVKGAGDWVLTSRTPSWRKSGMLRILLPSSTTQSDLQIMPMDLFLEELRGYANDNDENQE